MIAFHIIITIFSIIKYDTFYRTVSNPAFRRCFHHYWMSVSYSTCLHRI